MELQSASFSRSCDGRSCAQHEGYILAEYYGFKVNILLTFQAVKLSAYPIYQRFELFCKFFGDCWIHLGITSFLKGSVKLIEIGNLEDF